MKPFMAQVWISVGPSVSSVFAHPTIFDMVGELHVPPKLLLPPGEETEIGGQKHIYKIIAQVT